MKKCVVKIVLILLVLGVNLSQAQTSECSCATDSMQSFTLEKQEYRFSFTQLLQSFCFDHIVYTTFPRITVHIVNDTQDTLINLYRERDAHIMWMRSGELMDTIYPGQAMTLRGLAPGGKMIGTVNTSPIYLKYQIGDKIYNNKIALCGSMFPSDMFPPLSPAKKEGEGN